jgi:hypothetical protein
MPPDPLAKANGNNSASAGAALQRQWPVAGKGNLSRTPGSKNINSLKKYSVTQPNSPEHNPNYILF